MKIQFLVWGGGHKNWQSPPCKHNGGWSLKLKLTSTSSKVLSSFLKSLEISSIKRRKYNFEYIEMGLQSDDDRSKVTKLQDQNGIASQVEAMDILRCAPMSLLQLYIPMEAAQATVAELGSLGLVQFRDVRTKRPFTYIKGHYFFYFYFKMCS